MVKIGLSERQIEMLKLVNRFGFLSEVLIARFFDLTDNAIRKVRYELISGGCIRVEKIFARGDKYWVLEKFVINYLGGQSYRKISPATLVHNSYVHTIAINELKLGNLIKLEKEAKLRGGKKKKRKRK